MSQSRRAPRRRQSWLRRQLSRRPLPVWIVALAHLLALGIALVLFALPHHVIPRTRESLGVMSSRDAAPAAVQTAAPAASPDAAAQPDAVAQPDAAAQPDTAAQPDAATDPAAAPSAEPAPARTGDFSAKFADKFIQGAPQRTDTTYVSENLNLTITEYYVGGTRFYVADFYVRDISCFRTAFAKGKYGRNISENIRDVAMREQSVISINGDFYGFRDKGACVRNGELYYSKEIVRDMCVLYWDGRIECFAPDEFDCDREMANGAYQVWSFGPSILDANGAPKDDYGSLYEDISGKHPRSALGYFEPGHYCFITADGRTKDSRGLTLKQLGIVAQNLGCTRCYNMDGGQTAQMCYIAQIVNNPIKGGRDCSDYLTIVDRVS